MTDGTNDTHTNVDDQSPRIIFSRSRTRILLYSGCIIRNVSLNLLLSVIISHLATGCQKRLLYLSFGLVAHTLEALSLEFRENDGGISTVCKSKLCSALIMLSMNDR